MKRSLVLHPIARLEYTSSANCPSGAALRARSTTASSIQPSSVGRYAISPTYTVSERPSSAFCEQEVCAFQLELSIQHVLSDRSRFSRFGGHAVLGHSLSAHASQPYQPGPALAPDVSALVTEFRMNARRAVATSSSRLSWRMRVSWSEGCGAAPRTPPWTLPLVCLRQLCSAHKGMPRSRATPAPVFPGWLWRLMASSLNPGRSAGDAFLAFHAGLFVRLLELAWDVRPTWVPSSIRFGSLKSDLFVKPGYLH